MVNWWTLAARAQARRDVLLGYYNIPEHLNQILKTYVNPEGMEERCKPQVWNNGEGCLKVSC